MTRANLSLTDQFLGALNQGLQTLLPGQHQDPGPAAEIAETPLTAEEKTTAAQLLRVDHCGEVCAQALYLGQALTARDSTIRSQLQEAGGEEADHLRWCQQRLSELGDHSSRLDPLFFAGALSIGVLAGLAGDRWSLGFLAETERQVEAHLDQHLQQLPAADHRSRAILEQMKADEIRHAETATNAGAAELPTILQQLMRHSARVMTQTTRWV
ncbi:MAG: 2-polyprenyl-3-methyl-6-methoxy-1,4-benzoquinone monooxygenase [Gammaproteobacteria bacterium]|nr:2-polyprenyl-3-methyl-6-methoxy-1,4-benzoquinone monooxygenase [Gammaproteobacteria bacterium]